MDTKLFVLLSKNVSVPSVRNRRSHVIFQIMKSVWTERTFMHSLASFHMSSGFQWLFAIIANPARLMNNLGWDWALPDGSNEMPPLAFHQLGEIIPIWWWCWTTPAPVQLLITSHSLRSFFCVHFRKLNLRRRWSKRPCCFARDPPQSPLEAGWSPKLPGGS